MTIFTVHLPPDAEVSTGVADRIVFIREGFSWLAFLLPLPWLLVNRLWLALVAWLVVAAGLGGMSMWLSSGAVTALTLLLSLWGGLEARNIRRWTLERRGWRSVGVVEGIDRDAAERRFFADWLAGGEIGPVAPSPPPRPSAWRGSPVPHGGAIGLFPLAGGR